MKLPESPRPVKLDPFHWNTPNPTLLVTSMWVAAYLHMIHVPLLRVLPPNEKHALTAFEWDDDKGMATAARNDWWAGRAQVPSQQYLAARHELLRLKARAEETGQILKMGKEK